MASPDPLNVYANVRAIADEIDFNWSGGPFPLWVVQYNISTYALSAQHDSTSPIYDYYLVQLEGSALFQHGDSAWHLDAHGLQVFPVSNTGGVELIDHAPATTIGATSYSTSMTTTIGGSVGFMGESLTGSVSASVSTTSSKSYTISDLTIRDMSLMDSKPPVDAFWAFEVADGSMVQSSDCPIAAAFLYRVPHGAPNFQLYLYYSVFLVGGDGDDDLTTFPSSNSGGDGQVHMVPNFEGGPNPWLAGKARLGVQKTLTITAPPPPPAPTAK